MHYIFNTVAITENYTLSLHDALPISALANREQRRIGPLMSQREGGSVLPSDFRLRRRTWQSSFECYRPSYRSPRRDRKSTRLNSSHVEISYAVFCLKKKRLFLVYSTN